jgi:hypothetical protein
MLPETEDEWVDLLAKAMLRAEEIRERQIATCNASQTAYFRKMCLQ